MKNEMAASTGVESGCFLLLPYKVSICPFHCARGRVHASNRRAAAKRCRKGRRAHSMGCQLAIATVPMQRFEQLYPVPEAWGRGTLFAALDLPFCPTEVRHVV